MTRSLFFGYETYCSVVAVCVTIASRACGVKSSTSLQTDLKSNPS